MDKLSRVYIKIDENNHVVQIEGEYSLQNFKDLSECILVEEGEPCDRLNHAQNNYLNKPLRNLDGTYNYIWDGENIEEITNGDK